MAVLAETLREEEKSTTTNKKSRIQGVIVNPGREVAVIGAGVIGLTTALTLQERGYQVTIYTAKETKLTTSMKAGASFKPHAVVYTNNTHQMLLDSFGPYVDLSQDPNSGVRLDTHYEATDFPEKKDKRKARYLEVFENFKELDDPEAIPGKYKYAWRYTTPHIDPTVYLPYLEEKIKENGGVIYSKKFNDLEELTRLNQGVIFNCTGLGSRELFNDEKMIPIRGQIAVIDPFSRLGYSVSADGSYFYQQKEKTVLGGTGERGAELEITDLKEIARMVKGNQRVLTNLTPEMVKTTYAGLRPYRKWGIRLAAQIIGNKLIIHNYGHGGAGFTLAPGSAKMAIDLIA